jgi:uncharacterized protein (TIGR03067 family)
MTRSNTIRLAFLATLVLGTGAAAHAQSPHPDQMFRSLDADGDGRITMAEGGPQSRQLKQQIFTMAGKGMNDGINRAEFQAVFDRVRGGNGGGARPQPGTPMPPPAAAPSGTGRRIPSSAQPRATPSGTRPGASTQAMDPNTPQIWRGWIVQGRGDNPNENQMEIELTITGNQIRGRQVGRGGGPGGPPGGLGTGTFVMDAAAGTLDVTQTEGQNAGKHYPGIFSLDGDTLRWCVSNTERRRPTQLATLGASAYLMVLRRQAAP